MKDNTLREILDTGTIIVNVTSSGTGLSMTGQTNFTTHFGDDWGVVYKGKTVSLQEFIETLLDKEIQKARIEELLTHAPDWVEINDDGTVNPTAVFDRIRQLEKGE